MLARRQPQAVWCFIAEVSKLLPIEQIQSVAGFCMVCELRMVFTCLKIVQTKNRGSAWPETFRIFILWLYRKCLPSPAILKSKGTKGINGEMEQKSKEKREQKGYFEEKGPSDTKDKINLFCKCVL